MTRLNDANHKTYSAAPAPPAPINRKKESKLEFLNRLLIWQSMVVTEVLSLDGKKTKLQGLCLDTSELSGSRCPKSLLLPSKDIFKYLLNLLQYCLCFMFCFVWSGGTRHAES